MFDKRLCIANIYQLAKERGLKIGDIEKSAGVSAGYLSRINKDDNNTVPTIDFVAGVAEALGVTVDAIINNDYTSPTPTEKYILTFVDRLLAQTNADELDWKKETSAQLHAVGYDEQGDPNHPLFVMDFDDQQQPSPSYNSRFSSGFDVTGDCFYLTLPNTKRTVVYLMCVDDPEATGLPFAGDSYELYIVKEWKVQPLCHSLPVNSLFSDCLTKLYAAVKESCNHPKLDADIMSAIEAFMGDSEVDVNDEDLPF